MEHTKSIRTPLFLHSGFNLIEYRARPTSELKALSESGAFRMQTQGGIAVIPVRGPINRGEGYYGETDLNDVVANCQRAMADSSISGVIIKFDTPGGTASGCYAAAETIRALSSLKPTVSHCDMCCSAGYYLASQTNKIYATADSMVGSIGTTTELVDASKMYENMGVKVHEINTGKFKGVGNESQPVTEADIEYVQGIVDELFSGFLKSVANGRKISQQKVKDFEAKVFIGAKAIECGLVDGICSMTECFSSLNKMVTKKMQKPNMMASARLQVAQRKVLQSNISNLTRI